MRTAALLASLLLLAACGGPAQPQGRTLSFGDGQNGQSVSARVGDIVTVTLDSTAWTIAGSSDASVLQERGAQVVSPAPPGSCLPGMGCGTTSAAFKAVRAGTATVTATRLSCGEARRCVGPEGAYSLTVLVS